MVGPAAVAHITDFHLYIVADLRSTFRLLRCLSLILILTFLGSCAIFGGITGFLILTREKPIHIKFSIYRLGHNPLDRISD